MTEPTPADSTVPRAAADFGAGPVARSLWSDAFHTLRRRVDVIIATAVALFFVVVAAFPRLFTSANPKSCDISQSKIRPQWFDGPHPLGTDLHGCDVLAQTVHGARPSLLLAVIVVATSLLIAFVLGSLAGYYMGAVDAVISRALEVFYTIPFLLAALLILSLFRNVDFGNGLFAVMLPPAIVLILFGWVEFTRYVRASVLEAKNLDYVTAAKTLGAADVRIIFRHVLPNAIAPVTALIPTRIAAIISAEAVLAFLGIGIRPPEISWGISISRGADWFSGGYPHLLLPALICLLTTILSFVVIGDALRDALDPKLR